MAAGADAFLSKPLDPLELASTVKDLLGALLRGMARERGRATGSAAANQRGSRRRPAGERDQHADRGLRAPWETILAQQ
jgi:DNA-binding response OmpR family regulator